MENIPMKVETKTLAFTDPTAVANDRATGETSIIAFRACGNKNGRDGNAFYDGTGICFRKLFSFVKLICIS